MEDCTRPEHYLSPISTVASLEKVLNHFLQLPYIVKGHLYQPSYLPIPYSPYLRKFFTFRFIRLLKRPESVYLNWFKYELNKTICYFKKKEVWHETIFIF